MIPEREILRRNPLAKKVDYPLTADVILPMEK
jgi:hypothetical protein